MKEISTLTRLYVLYVPYDKRVDKFAKNFKLQTAHHIFENSTYLTKKNMPVETSYYFMEFLEMWVFKKYNKIINEREWVVEFIKNNLKKKNKVNCHLLIDIIFLHLGDLYPLPEIEGNREFYTGGSNLFLRVGDVLAVRDLNYKFYKKEYSYNSETIALRLDKYPYNKIIKMVRNTVKRQNKIVNERKAQGLKINKGVDEILLNFLNIIDKETLGFALIPETAECNLVTQLHELYSDLLREYKEYSKKASPRYLKMLECYKPLLLNKTILPNEPMCEETVECITNYLEIMQGFFSIFKKNV